MQITLACDDNLTILKNKSDNSIDCIYNDILYNTGKTFKDFSDNIGTIEDCLHFYHPRFTEMKRVLKDSGLLYIHCDYNLSHYIKVLLDGIFGIDNFRNEIIW